MGGFKIKMNQTFDYCPAAIAEIKKFKSDEMQCPYPSISERQESGVLITIADYFVTD